MLSLQTFNAMEVIKAMIHLSIQHYMKVGHNIYYYYYFGNNTLRTERTRTYLAEVKYPKLLPLEH